ncbi:dihydroxy-acid dehydratase domain-containing protein, partial [Paenibacillus phytohabitans]|uniref:dihydroxy-acid dehydratase domain-containing protein n=1 Tax=Paenibacillus phytohabitans TaxID=2654978 RepID=UPI0030092A8A
MDDGIRGAAAGHLSERDRRSALCELVRRDIRPRDIMTAEAMENAITVTMASGGSTNAIIHLVAISQRLGRKLPLET